MIQTSAFVAGLVASLPGAAAILDGQRRLLAANDRFIAAVLGGDGEPHLGARPGDFLQCRNAAAAPGGCGTSARCGDCGAMQALQLAIGGETCRTECTIARVGRLGDLRLKIRTRPLEIGGGRFLVLTID